MTGVIKVNWRWEVECSGEVFEGDSDRMLSILIKHHDHIGLHGPHPLLIIEDNREIPWREQRECLGRECLQVE